MEDEKDALLMKHIPTAERPRERLKHVGVGSLSNAELLAILLRTGTKQENVVTLAQRILTGERQSLAFLYDATVEELTKVKGIGGAKSCSILAAVELGKRVVAAKKGTGKFVRSPEDAAALMMDQLRFEKKEHVYLILLNSKVGVIDVINISIGGLNSSILHPREVFMAAVRHSAASIVLVHNHPSGDPTPSGDDIEITKRIFEAGKIMGIELVDHIVIGDNIYVSMREKGIL